MHPPFPAPNCSPPSVKSYPMYQQMSPNMKPLVLVWLSNKLCSTQVCHHVSSLILEQSRCWFPQVESDPAHHLGCDHTICYVSVESTLKIDCIEKDFPSQHVSVQFYLALPQSPVQAAMIHPHCICFDDYGEDEGLAAEEDEYVVPPSMCLTISPSSHHGISSPSMTYTGAFDFLESKLTFTTCFGATPHLFHFSSTGFRIISSHQALGPVTWPSVLMTVGTRNWR